MSKLLNEVTAHMLQVRFLATIQPEPCNEKGTMEIIVEEVNDDGSPWTKQATRFVKVCHSRNECSHYEIAIDPNTGIGSLSIQDVEAMNMVIVQVDDCGNQVMNGDEYEISYMVNDDVMEEDYASVSMENNAHQTVRIINRRMQKSSLDITKVIRNCDGSVCENREDEEFLVRISKGDCFERFVKMNACNNFHVCIQDLRAGVYTIEEYEYCEYTPFYKLNGNQEDTSTQMELLAGNNTLEIINEKRQNTQVTIEKYVRNACGELCKPSSFEEFEIQIRSEEYEEFVVLSEENDFCVSVYGLVPGVYEIQECNVQAMYDTSYIVNDEEEHCRALVEVCRNKSACVWVINSITQSACMETMESALRICKYIRRCDGCIVKPDCEEQFKVMVSGCGMKETFFLNENNNFCVDLASLCVGNYEIEEVSCKDYMTSYSINGERERTSACIYYDGYQPFCVSIINEERNRGNIRISKYIRNEYKDLIKPNKNQCFQVTLSSYFCKRCFELNEENNFTMCFHDLRFGSYEIREEEVCGYDTSYQVDCEKEKRFARITIDNGCEHEVKIINQMHHTICGVLSISKYVETNCKELVKPARDEEFEVEIDGPCFCEHYVLRAGNNWSIQIEGLKEGEYRIKECGCDGYDVSYFVNKEHSSEAIVYMGECNQEVCIINHPCHCGNIQISSCIRTCDQELIKPHGAISFEILIEGSDDCTRVCLNAENNWCATIDDVCEGKYRIIQKDTMGYKVSYFIHGKEESFGKLKLGCQDEEVTIINEETPCMGSVIVTKYVMDEDGTMVKPCPQDEYHFELSGRCFTRTYTLCNRNDFCIYFDDLDEGEYEICELDEGFDVQYRIHGECVDHVRFALSREDVHVDIINCIQQRGLVQIEKRIRKGNTLLKPCEDEEFQILVKGKNCHEVYELNACNDFCITLCDMQHQHYEIKELQNNGCVSYEVDGHMQEEGYFLFDGEDIHVMIINEEKLYGCMELRKVIAAEDGSFYRPSRFECFEVLVESDCFKQKVVLNNENNFCCKLYDLPQAHYEVKELNNEGCVRYLINDLPYESACVDVCEEDVCITIINYPCVKGSLHFEGFVEEQGCIREARDEAPFELRITNQKECYNVILEHQNGYRNVVCDILPGDYHVEEIGSDCISFMMEDQCFDDEVCIALDGQDVCVHVIRHLPSNVNITIHKCCMDQKGNMYEACGDASYDVVLQGAKSCETFTLNQQNHFTHVVKQQPRGAYEVKVCGYDDVVYQIDHQGMQSHGCFQVDTNDVCVHVINKDLPCAYLHVESRVKDCDGRLIRPDRSMIFQVDVSSSTGCEHLVLNASNGWHCKLYLEVGEYQVVQKPNANFCEVSYMVNDEEVTQAIVNLCEEDQFVTTLNMMNCATGSIEICKLIKDDEGCYRYPNEEDSFWIQVQSNQTSTRLLLNRENRFYACVRGLQDGWYEILEEGAQEGVEYIVNNAASSMVGNVHVRGNANTVNIINPQHSGTVGGSIALQKFIETDDGVYEQPNKGVYRIHVSKPGYNELFYLDKENKYQMVIHELEDGLYVIDEVDQEGVSYIVNGGSVVDYASVRVQGNANTVDVINAYAPQRSGSITLAKYIRKDGQLKRPNKEDSYVFLVSRPGFHELYTLDVSNHWMYTIQHLEDGDYVISETEDNQAVTYIINGQTEVDRAIVSVQGNSNTIQIINTVELTKGSIHIEKYIREGNKLRRPTGMFRAMIYISKPGYYETFTLDASNAWMVDINDLDPGLYVIDEIDTNDEISYIINGGSEVKNGVVSLDRNVNMVMMIDTINDEQSSLTLTKYIRMSDATMVLPSGTDRFQVEITGDNNYQNIVTLDASNQWTTRISSLVNGYYEVKEMSNQGYSVSYIVDNDMETANASVRILNNAHSVRIVNSSGEMMGRLEIIKQIKNADGSTIVPADGDVYFIEITNENTLRKIQLDSGNNFTRVLQDLPQGEYRIREVNGLNYLTTYRINGGVEELIANVTVASGINNTVEVLNELRGNRNVIEVFKYMLDTDGNYTPPTVPDVYYFTITGLDNEIRETYELNVDNSWNQSIRTLPSGRYQIIEMGTSPYPVKYLINSADLKDEAIFEALPGATSVIGIINQVGFSGVGQMTITKRIRDVNGSLSIPTNGEIFTVNVTSTLQNQIITLEPENNYTFVLSDIPFGNYTIEEVTTSYTVSYRVNEGIETPVGFVNVDSTAGNVVLVINTPMSPVIVTQKQDTMVHVVIE